MLGAHISFGIRKIIFVFLVDEVADFSTKAISDSNFFVKMSKFHDNHNLVQKVVFHFIVYI